MSVHRSLCLRKHSNPLIEIVVKKTPTIIRFYFMFLNLWTWRPSWFHFCSFWVIFYVLELDRGNEQLITVSIYYILIGTALTIWSQSVSNIRYIDKTLIAKTAKVNLEIRSQTWIQSRYIFGGLLGVRWSALG